MGFGGEIDDRLHPAGDNPVHELAVPDVPQDEFVIFRRREVGQVFEVAGVGQLVQVDDLILAPVFRAKQATDEIGPDKSGPAGDEDFHS